MSFYHLIDPTNKTEAEEFVKWVHFHTTVCKHKNVVQMLHCQTKSLPMYLMLEACNPGNLLHFLWSLRNVMLGHNFGLKLTSYLIMHAISKLCFKKIEKNK